MLTSRMSTVFTIAFLSLSLSSSTFPIVAGHKKSHDRINAPLLTSKIAANRSIIVGPSEEFKTVQAAIDAVPEGNKEWIVVHLRAGIYRFHHISAFHVEFHGLINIFVCVRREKVVIPEDKDYIFLRGSGKGRTAIVWDDSSTNNTLSSTFIVWADNFVAFGISFKNDAPMGVANTPYNQSVAAMVAGDKAAFYHCAFYSAHNTLFDYRGRHYYESCYVQGNIDFIFGRGQSIFQSCEIFVLQDNRKKILGSITAQNRESADETSGFVFHKAKVYGVGDVYLGRAKGAYSRVIFAETYLSKTITPRGWTNWSYDGETDNLLHGEYECHGPGSELGSRVSWSQQLTKEEASPFLSIDFIDGKEWLPAYY
ncbi:probable pectinesterase 67 isoform X1 [Zingiber officinale]|uniref:probable pectinesterase 67 isoform X1 n=1 Tax=Zingiber officinale TaxID=94328 RepID=UPI001C4BCB8E|nr:probable pectinesterase 67 isoform X1 [Zingiber officinale]